MLFQWSLIRIIATTDSTILSHVFTNASAFSRFYVATVAKSSILDLEGFLNRPLAVKILRTFNNELL